MRRREAAGLLAILPGALPRARAAELSPAPEEHYRTAVADPELNKGTFGEGFCWHAAFHMGAFLQGYRAFRDTAWLDQGVRYYDHVLGRMQTGPDGYRGWIGPYMYDASVWCDVHVGDAILLTHMLAFAEEVLGDAALANRYGAAARRYIAIARRDLFEKWDARGTWYEDGPFGGYRSWNRYGDPDELKRWTERNHIRNSGLSLPFNKHEDMGSAALKLWRITGERLYLERARRIFAFHKSRFQLVDGGYVWNYWEPMGPFDVADGKTRHWVGVHPYRNYQAGEVSKIVEAYHTGVVFDRVDIERILHTNLRIMWNGDAKTPQFRNSDATLSKPPHNQKVTAGTLWTALAPFSQTVRDLYLPGSPLARAYFEKVTCAAPPGFARKHAEGIVAGFDFTFHDCREINMAAALPSVIRVGEETMLAANALRPGHVRVGLWQDGQETTLLYNGKAEGLLLVWWKPERPIGGRVRWSFVGGGYREFPVSVRA